MADSLLREMATSDVDFVKQTWNCHKIENDFYIIKYNNSQNEFKILVSDGINLWYEFLTETQLQDRHDELNPTVESPVDQILTDVENIIKNLESDKNISVSAKHECNKLNLICKNAKSDEPAPFVWNFHLSEHDKTLFANHLTFPFVSMMAEQEARIKRLCQIILEKDTEILDYKLSGATLSRARLETKKFDKSQFLKQTHSNLDELRNSSPVELLTNSDKLQTLYRTMTDLVRLKIRTTSDLVKESGTKDTENEITALEIKEKRKPDFTDSEEIEADRRTALKKRLLAEEKAKEEKRKKKKIIKL